MSARLRRVTVLVSIWLALAFVTLGHSQAGIYPAGGSATLVIDGPDVKTGQVVFPDELPIQFNAESRDEGDGALTEINFSRSIERQGAGTEYYQVDIKDFPSGPGTFTIPLPDQPTPKNSTAVDIQYNMTDGRGVMTTSLHLSSAALDGVNGSVTISQYPEIGGRIVGSFTASLHDVSHGFYKVSGTFSIKRQR